MATEAAKAMVSKLGAELGIDGLALDEYGYCCLEFPDQTINLETDDNGILSLYAHLGNIPREDRESFFATLLEANYFCQQTGGGTIGIDREANVVLLLMQTHVSALNTDDLRSMVSNFLNVAVIWSRRIAAHGGNGQPATATGNDSPPPGLRV
jgi:hypothetical protein